MYILLWISTITDDRATHIDHIIKKAKQKIGCLWCVRIFLPQSSALLLYKSLVLPHFDYGDIIYCHTTQENLLCLQVMQNNACRMILRTNKYSTLELNTLLERRLFHVSLTMFKIHKEIVVAPLLINVFVSLEDTHGGQTRAVGRNDLVVISTRRDPGVRK